MGRQLEKSDPEYQYKKAYKIFDKKKDGVICCAELKHIMTNLGEGLSDNEIQEMMNEADLNRDGLLDYEEFLNIMLAK